LNKRGVFIFDEIEPILKGKDTFLANNHFLEEIKDLGSFLKSKSKLNDIDQLIEHGYIQSSIEYCLKYDVIDSLLNMDGFHHTTSWSPFEWSNKPEYLDLLSFSVFFLAPSSALSIF